MTEVLVVVAFVAAYILIATERIHRVAAALCGAAAMVVLGVVDAHVAFFSEETGVDWNVIFLLLGMMVIVSVLKQTGVFDYLAIWAAKRTRGRPFATMVLLVVITAGGSALLDNVTTVLLIVPVTLLVCDRLGLPPVPFLIAEAHGLQHRGHRHPGRRPAQHHHRQPRGPELQRLPGPPGPHRAGPDGGVHRNVPGLVPVGVSLRPRPGVGTDGPGRAGGDPRPRAAAALRGGARLRHGRLHRPLRAAPAALHGRPAGGWRPGRGVQTRPARVPGGGGVAHAGVLHGPVRHGGRADPGWPDRAARPAAHRCGG